MLGKFENSRFSFYNLAGPKHISYVSVLIREISVSFPIFMRTGFGSRLAGLGICFFFRVRFPNEPVFMTIWDTTPTFLNKL